MFERFSSEARAAVVAAYEAAAQLGLATIEPEHLLIAVAERSTSTAGRLLLAKGLTAAALRTAVRQFSLGPLDGPALAVLGIDLDQVRRAAEASFGVGALDALGGRADKGRLSFGPRGKRTLELALHAAVAVQSKSIYTAHILIGLIDGGPGVADRVLRELGVDPTVLRNELAAADGHAAA